VVGITPWPHFTSREKAPGTHCIEGWVGHRVRLDTETRRKILILIKINSSFLFQLETCKWGFILYVTHNLGCINILTWPFDLKQITVFMQIFHITVYSYLIVV
jgi:hypothetical protein